LARSFGIPSRAKASISRSCAIQDWYLRYQLNSVDGVSEVASIGGFVKQYQIDVHPDKLRAHRVTLMDVYEAVRKSNIDVGGKVLEKNGIEFFIRGVGFIKSVEDLEKVVLRQEKGTSNMSRR
jgi:Cu(I)/Ag(I) efflux system membrane protein CusA/SilA